MKRESKKTRIPVAGAGLRASFMAVPALTKPRSLKELTSIAQDEHAAEAAREVMKGRGSTARQK